MQKFWCYTNGELLNTIQQIIVPNKCQHCGYMLIINNYGSLKEPGRFRSHCNHYATYKNVWDNKINCNLNENSMYAEDFFEYKVRQYHNRTEWYSNMPGESYGKLHRDGKPAIEYDNGCYKYYLNGLLHNLEGLAVNYTGGNVCGYYYINGHLIYGSQYKQAVSRYKEKLLKENSLDGQTKVIDGKEYKLSLVIKDEVK